MTIFLNTSFLSIFWGETTDRPTKIVVIGMMAGIIMFVGFELMTVFSIAPLGIPFNNFFSVIGVILFFIAGFFFLSLTTIPKN